MMPADRKESSRDGMGIPERRWIATNPPEDVASWSPAVMHSETEAEAFQRAGWTIEEVVPAPTRGAVDPSVEPTHWSRIVEALQAGESRAAVCAYADAMREAYEEGRTATTPGAV